MKKLLCVLMFGMVFGADAITTREFSVTISSESENIDISQYVDLVDGLYVLDLLYGTVNDYEINEPCWDGYDLFSPFHLYGNNYSSALIFETSWGDLVIQFPKHHFVFSSENPILEIVPKPQNEGCFSATGDFIIRVSGRFDDTDVGLQGDMNDDDSLDVIDVVMLVDVIINGGGVGDIGDLINIVRG